MKRIGLAFAILAMFGLSFAAFSVSGATNKDVFKPGESGAIVLTVSNAAGGNDVTGAKVEVIGSPSFTYTGTINIGDMNAGTSTTLTVPLTVKPDTLSGVYIFNIKVYGTEKTGTGTESLNMKQASIAVYVLNKPVIFVDNYDKDYNEKGNFSFTINNQGGSAKNARLRALAPFAIAGANEIYLGEIAGQKNVSFQLDVSGVGEGSNTLQLNFVYDDELGNEVSETKNVSLTVKKETPDINFVQLSRITSNMDNTAKFRVVNGAKELRNVKLSFSDQDIILKEGSEIRVGDLASGETKEITFTMHPDISPGTANENATITYTSEGKEQTKAIKVPLTVESDSDVQVYLEAKPIPVTGGQEETLSVTVANTWDYPIESTSVKIGGEFFDLLSVQDEQYIGLLNKDDFSSVQFKVRIRDGAPADSNLTVRVKYKDAFGNFIEREKQLQVKIAAKPAAQGDSLPLVLGAVAVAAAVYWLFFRKKKAAA